MIISSSITGKRTDRVSIIAARDHNHNLIAPMIYDGTADTTLVLFWVEHILIPTLPKNSITIWDNASYHKSKRIEELLNKHGHTIKFLPAYSPELNPIENLWGTLKQRLKGYWNSSKDLLGNLIDQVNYLSVNI
jgi:transposase